MSKYKIGDIVKMRNDLEHEEYYSGQSYNQEMDIMKDKPIILLNIVNVRDVENYIVRDEKGEKWFLSDEMIEGLWGKDKEKQDKLKLIDVLNMIAKGELKEGTRVKYKNIEWEYKTFGKEGEKDLVDKANFTLFEQFYMDALSEEVELIEPPCEHEWLDWETHRIGEGQIRGYRRCNKCGLEEETEKCISDEGKTLEPAKIDELDEKEFAECDTNGKCYRLFYKLNEVIRKINKE